MSENRRFPRAAINPITGQPLTVSVDYGAPASRPERRFRPGIEESKGEPVFLAPLTPNGGRKDDDTVQAPRPFLQSTVGGPADEFSSPTEPRGNSQRRQMLANMRMDDEIIDPASTSPMGALIPNRPVGNAPSSSHVAVNFNVDQLIGIIFDLRSTLSQEIEGRRQLEAQLSDIKSSVAQMNEESRNSSKNWVNVAGRLKELEVQSAMENKINAIAEQSNTQAMRLDAVKIQNLLADFKGRLDGGEKYQREELMKARNELFVTMNQIREMDSDMKMQVANQMKLHDEQLGLKLIQLEAKSGEQRAYMDLVEKMRKEVSELQTNQQVVENTIMNMRIMSEKGEATEKDWVRTFIQSQLDSFYKQVELKFSEMQNTNQSFESRIIDKQEQWRNEVENRLRTEEEKNVDNQRKLSATIKHSYQTYNELLKSSLLTIEKRINENQQLASEGYNSLHNTVENLQNTIQANQALINEVAAMQNKLQQRSLQVDEKQAQIENVLKTEIKTRIKGYQKNKALIESKYAELIKKEEKDVTEKIRLLGETVDSLQSRIGNSRQQLDAAIAQINAATESRFQLQLSNIDNKLLEYQGKINGAIQEQNQYYSNHLNNLQQQFQAHQADVKAALTLQHEFTTAQAAEVRAAVEQQVKAQEETAAISRAHLDEQNQLFKQAANESIQHLIEQITLLKDQNQAEFDEMHNNVSQSVEQLKVAIQLVQNEGMQRDQTYQHQITEIVDRVNAINQNLSNSNTQTAARLDALEINFNADGDKGSSGNDGSWREALLLCDERNNQRVEEVKAMVVEMFHSNQIGGGAAQFAGAKEDEEEAANSVYVMMETRAVMDDLVNHVEEKYRHEQRRAERVADRMEILHLAQQISGELKALDERLAAQENLTDKHEAQIEDFFVILANNKEKHRAIAQKSDELQLWIGAHSNDIKTLNEFVNLMHEQMDGQEENLRGNSAILEDLLKKSSADRQELKLVKKTVFDMAKSSKESLDDANQMQEQLAIEVKDQRAAMEEMQETTEEIKNQLRAIQGDLTVTKHFMTENARGSAGSGVAPPSDLEVASLTAKSDQHYRDLRQVEKQLAELQGQLKAVSSRPGSDTVHTEVRALQILCTDLQTQLNVHKLTSKESRDIEAREMAAVVDQIESLVKSSKLEYTECKDKVKAVEAKVEKIIHFNALRIE